MVQFNSFGDSSTSRRSLAGERRIVTILFSDVKGSTAMAEHLDPEDWAEIMNEAFGYLTEPIVRYGGTVARLMGDAILAFFGAPTAHEDRICTVFKTPRLLYKIYFYWRIRWISVHAGWEHSTRRERRKHWICPVS